ncbi:MAG TPA: shikimate dehydrogenase [Gemmatimonas sp.]|nr:shikimate dehydrogenase [Gemmatimonas sp.]
MTTAPLERAAPLPPPAPPDALLLIGHPVAHSLSPRFQNAALRACSLRQTYTARDVPPEALPGVLSELAAGSVRGTSTAGNVTLPLKELVFDASSHRSALAERVGAANTFWFDEGELFVHNTDVAGAHRAIRALCPDGIAGAPCALLGAGGSAAAVLVALDELGAGGISMASRTPARVHALAARVGVSVTAVSDIADAVDGAMLVVNATPVGLRDDAMIVQPAALSRGSRVLDLVYRHGETAWVRACRDAGLDAQDGLRMLVEQGAAAFECWFGIEAPRRAMWRALEADA